VELTTQDKAVRVRQIEFPKGEMKHDANFGDMMVYHHPFEARINLERSDKGARTLSLHAVYQGCSEKGLCYAPIERDIQVALPAVTASTSASPSTAADNRGDTTSVSSGAKGEVAVVASEDTQIASLLKQGNFWLIMASFFGAGLLLAFTPCMFPMVPILSGIIVGRGHNITHKHGFILSFSYVLGMALTYAAVGVVAGYSGTLLSNVLQTPWVLGGFALMFVVLALAMFGFFELQLPSALQSRLAETSNKLHGGHITGVFAMGALSVVIVGPCVAPPLAGALIYIGQTHDAFMGGMALFALGMGMGVPLMVIGASAGTLLPKAGAWMESVKRLFGVMLLGVAIWIASPLLPMGVQMMLWAMLLILSGIFLHALDALPHNASHWHKLWKGVGVLAMLVGIAYLIGALSGSRDILRPLAVLGGARAEAQTTTLPFIRIKSLAELEGRIASAAGRPVVLDFYADWCVSCKEMERFTFQDAKVQARLQKPLLLQADVTEMNGDDRALLKRFNIYGPPAMLFFDGKGQERQDRRVVGFQDVTTFLRSLQNAGL